MKRLSEFEDEKALDLLTVISEPIVEIMSDESFQKAFQAGSGQKIVDVVNLIIKEHKKAVISILAAFNDVPVEEYHYNLVTLIKDVLYVFSDPLLTDFFPMQGQNTLNSVFGSATENTEEGVQ